MNDDSNAPAATAATAMPGIDYRQIIRDGLWNKNAVTVQMLGLCPMLAVSGSVVNGLGMGLATVVVLALSNAAVSLARAQVPDEIRLPIFVMIIASATTGMEFVMQAFAFGMYEVLGIFIALITTNCSVLARAESFAAKNPVLPSMLDGFVMGLGFMAVLVLLGAMRELFGNGTLFANMDLLFGPLAKDWVLHPFSADYPGFLFAVLPPGAFFFLGLIIAGKNVIDQRLKEREKARAEPAVKTSRRVRTTG
jgi:electron transport complex protein RnfE